MDCPPDRTQKANGTGIVTYREAVKQEPFRLSTEVTGTESDGREPPCDSQDRWLIAQCDYARPKADWYPRSMELEGIRFHYAARITLHLTTCDLLLEILI